MSYTTPLIEYMHTLSSQSYTKESCTVSHSINNGLIQTDYACDLLLHFLMHTIIPIADEEYSSLKNILKVVERLSDIHSEANSFVLASQHAIATILYIMHDAVAKYEQGRKFRFQNRQGELFTEFFRLLTNNYKQQRSVIYYAEQMCLTPRHLSRITKEFSGRTAAEWINAFVVTEIQYQIRYTYRSVQQIAYDLNFPHQSFLGKYFKARVGCSPKAYRLR